MRRPSPAQRHAGSARSAGRPDAAAAAGPEQAPTRRLGFGLRHSQQRDASAISYHYDVSNDFYELVLGPSMAYTCAVLPDDGLDPGGGPGAQVRPGRSQARAHPGMRLLDVGCGWGGMVRHAVRTTASPRSGSRCPASRPAGRPGGSRPRAWPARPRSGTWTTGTSSSGTSTRSASIGLIEHIGVKNYPAYFRFLRSSCVRGGRLLSHGITRPGQHQPGPAAPRLHRPVRLPRRGADRLRRHRPRDRGRRPRGAAPGEPARCTTPRR